MATNATAMKLEIRSFMVHDEDGEREGLALVPDWIEAKGVELRMQRRRAISDRVARGQESCARRETSSCTDRMSKREPKIKLFVEPCSCTALLYASIDIRAFVVSSRSHVSKSASHNHASPGYQAAGVGRIASLLLVASSQQGSSPRPALRPRSAAWLGPARSASGGRKSRRDPDVKLLGVAVPSYSYAGRAG